jgi:hypothetical protein
MKYEEMELLNYDSIKSVIVIELMVTIVWFDTGINTHFYNQCSERKALTL